MNNLQDKFFQLLRLSFGISSGLPDVHPEEWKHIYEMSKKQSLLGIVLDGVEKMGNTARMDSGLLINWIGKCKLIERRNYQLNEAVVNVSDYFKKNGFDSCILKGQGNALMYLKSLHRTPGDIDIWVSGRDSDVIRFVHSIAPNEKASYHHIDFPAYKGIPLEVHYRPCYLQNPIYNARLQRFFQQYSAVQFGNIVKTEQGQFSVPTNSFNVIYQLVHIYNHLFQEGIGLRQIIDYYYVITNIDSSITEMLRQQLKHIGLWKFAGAMMYVLHEVLGLQEGRMIVPMDKKRGVSLLNEIMRGGNFGNFDERFSWGHGAIGHNVQRLLRDLRLARYYPAEALSEPVFRIWHFGWRMWHK